MDCICVVRRYDRRLKVHTDVIGHLKVMHVCKDVGVQDLEEIEGYCCYCCVVPVSTIDISIPLGGLCVNGAGIVLQ